MPAVRRLPWRVVRSAISAVRHPAPPLRRGRTAPSATSRARRTRAPSGRRTPRARCSTRRARRSVLRSARAWEPCAAGRCPDPRSRRCRNTARRGCGRGGIRRGRPCSRSAGISWRRIPRGPACRVPRQASRSSQAVPSFFPLPPQRGSVGKGAGVSISGATGGLSGFVSLVHHMRHRCVMRDWPGGRRRF